MSRETPEEYLESRLETVTALDGRIYPNLQTLEEGPNQAEVLLFPACVYQAVSGESVTTFGEGPVSRTCSFRVDFRSPRYTESVQAGRQALTALRAGGRLRDLSGPIDLYDADGAYHRRIWTVKITV